MRFPIVKTLTVAAALAVAWNCSEEAASSQPAEEQGAVNAMPMRWFFQGEVTYVILAGGDTFPVLDAEGNTIGAFDIFSGTILGMQGEVIATNVDLAQCVQIDPDGTIHNPDGSVFGPDGQMLIPASSAVVELSSAALPLQESFI